MVWWHNWYDVKYDVKFTINSQSGCYHMVTY